eukprot:1159741-Pelagomonas_calceolata.AAC.8
MPHPGWHVAVWEEDEASVHSKVPAAGSAPRACQRVDKSSDESTMRGAKASLGWVILNTEAC